MNIKSKIPYRQVPVWIAAFLTGGVAVVYAKLMGRVQAFYLSQFDRHELLVSLCGPLLFVAAAALVRLIAPHAKGSGIPQVLEAVEGAHERDPEENWKSPLVSARTAIVKVVSSLVGLLGGASIGREGPTVQIAASVYGFVGRSARRFSLPADYASFLTAGAAAGVAAAFNTPLAGITFAIEEVIEGAFGSFRQLLMLSVIISGITSQAILGDYLYFGHPVIAKPDFSVVYEALVIGVAGGIMGGIFARILAEPKVVRLPKHWAWRAFLCGVICSVCAFATKAASSGSGYEVTSRVLEASTLTDRSLAFPFVKLSTTILSYLSGMAGGIFSPSLSIGSGLGIAVSNVLHWDNFHTCALLGMVAFFSGAIQAPFTAVIIVTEMTDQHILILPFMVAGFLAQTVSRKIMPTPLYRYLANRKEEA